MQSRTRRLWILLAGITVPALLSTAPDAPAATVGYWTFDGGEVGVPAVTLQSGVNSPALDGTAGPINGGSAPVYSSPVPGLQITAGLGGPLLNAANSTSLDFTNAGFPGSNTSNVGGVVSITDPGVGSLVKLESFTIEGFIRYEDFALFNAIFTKNRADGGGSSWMLDTDGTGKLRARFDSQALGTSGATAPGFNQSFTGSATINDGLWHHVALTYDGTLRTARLFIDYVDVGGGTVTNPLVYDDSPLRFGGSGGGRAFDGDMDEVRLSDTVLSPNDFLRAVPEPGTAGLLVAGALALAGRRRRR